MTATTCRRRLTSTLLVPVASLLILAGCVGQRDPDSWNDKTKEAFVEACDGSAAKREPVEDMADDLEAAALPTEQCTCIIDHLEENMEFSEFKEANSKRRDETDERTPLTGGGFDEAYAACVPGFAPNSSDAPEDEADQPVEGSEDGSTEGTGGD